MSLSDSFRDLASCKVSKGDTTMFWFDLWDFEFSRCSFPQLFSFIQKDTISVAKFLDQSTQLKLSNTLV